ncbi:hypothetical protein [Shewanella glacialimarina]|uniref:hypothetical protein n=1 Tax=Shewanella glacialimarina TaxID=2590884 RepID=UPI001CF87886|nr:hypothetical protein [Shewanella glacialimarina]UCX05791.1 hypothetical protein FJ709_15655 [Shewanella glacialimarina]
MNLKNVQTAIKGKTASYSCKNCDRLTEIEGEMVCFEQGKIIRLVPLTEPDTLIKLVCIGWKKK